MSADKKIVIGMFVHNEEKHVEEAVVSLLNQTHHQFRLIILNDCSTDSTDAIIRRLAEKDPRIDYFTNTVRRGYIANYRAVFERADRDTEYFAWVAGHDVHCPMWLEKMQESLNKYPEVVMAYPLTKRIDACGNDYNIPSPEFDTFGMSEWQRVKVISTKGVAFGNMIYGLFRANVLRDVGVFRSYLVPDTLLLTELSRLGTILQVKEVLWHRRFIGLFSVSRQRKNAFAKRPWYLYLPWPLVNSVVLFWHTVLSRKSGGLWQRIVGMRLTGFFFAAWSYRWIRICMMKQESTGCKLELGKAL